MCFPTFLQVPTSHKLYKELNNHSQVIDETLSPTWDELLVFPRLVVHGRREDIKRTPPLVTIEIYDYDKVSL